MCIADRHVLHLIRLWLNCTIVEYDDQGRTTTTRPTPGTPQGGVISPLLSNIYLHWFEKAFDSRSGPGTWANAHVVRYADDFVVLAGKLSEEVISWIETQLEARFRLTINREKTRVVHLHPSAGTSLDFLSFTLRYDRDLSGRNRTYLNVMPSWKALAKLHDKLRTLTGPSQCWKPIPDLIQELNQSLHGWANYFRHGYPSAAFRKVNWWVQERLRDHLNRRSQRRYRPPQGKSLYEHFRALGLNYLNAKRRHGPATDLH